MATGMAVGERNKALDALVGNAAYAANVNDPWIKLHLGDPGAAGTLLPAVETTRKQASFGAAAAGQVANDVAFEWASYPAAEDPTHFSAWSAAAAGTFWFSGTITANAVAVGDTYRVAIGAAVTSISGAA